MADHESQEGCDDHGHMALESKYRLEQFSRVFDLRNSEGKPYLLIGGQAVNWAERYLKEDPNLEQLQPFTSRVGYLLRITSTKPAIRIASDLGLSWRDSLPWDAIRASPDPKIIRFAATTAADQATG